MKKNIKKILIILPLLLVGIVGTTYAYIHNKDSFDNTFNVTDYGTISSEIFESPKDWLPGESIEKKLNIKNTGSIPLAVRVSFTEEWKDVNQNIIEDDPNFKAAIINHPNNDWIAEETEENGTTKTYYYYKYALKKNEKSSDFIDKVTLNEDLEIEYTCTDSQVTDNGTITSSKCQPKLDKYVGATYLLEIKIETIQYEDEIYKKSWNTNVLIEEKNK